MKSVILNVRIPIEIKNALTNESNRLKINLSHNIREILSTHCNGTEDNDSKSILGNELYNSSEFLFLIVWLMEKRRLKTDNNGIRFLMDLKNVSLKVIKDEDFPAQIREEFEKVYFELTKYINHFGSPNNSFDFCDPYIGKGFDYSLLLGYINKKAFENRI